MSTPLPYGLRDVKVFPLTGDIAGSGVDLPNAQTFTFSETEEFEELRGDDAVVAVRGSGASVNWELSSGGVPLEALKIIAGGTITTSGVTPNVVTRYRKNQNDSRPYFRVEGKAISDSGGDFHVVLYRCRTTGEISGELSDGAYWINSTSGRAIGRESDGLLFDFIQNETEKLVSVIPEMDEVVEIAAQGTATGGTFTLSFGGDETSPIPFDATAPVVQQLLEELESIGIGNVIVTGNAGGPWTITFVGSLAASDVGVVTADDTDLEDATIEVTVVTPGGRPA